MGKVEKIVTGPYGTAMKIVIGDRVSPEKAERAIRRALGTKMEEPTHEEENPQLPAADGDGG